MNIKSLMDGIFTRIEGEGVGFAVRYWDGDTRRYGGGADHFLLHLRDENVCKALFSNIRMRFGEAYMSGAIEVEGDLQRLVQLLFLYDFNRFRLSLRERLKLAWMSWSQRNSIPQAGLNIKHHYDLGNEFYKLWLGREMAYSCAYFETGLEDIDTAQEQKFRHLCSKLHLRAGEELLDIGCGWGGLVMYAARTYGVRCLGVTISEQQMQLARGRVKAAGLEDLVRIELKDYRDLRGTTGFHKVVSVGMVEHVGREYLSEYIHCTARLLRPGGIGVLQSIGRMVGARTNPWISKYIFPGMYIPSLSDLATCQGMAGLIITDVEVLRLHYARTIDLWIRGFEAVAERVSEMYDPEFVRMWRFYLESCAAGMRYGDLCLWQIQYTKGLRNDLPVTRRYLYSDIADGNKAATDVTWG